MSSRWESACSKLFVEVVYCNIFKDLRSIRFSRHIAAQFAYTATSCNSSDPSFVYVYVFPRTILFFWFGISCASALLWPTCSAVSNWTYTNFGCVWGELRRGEVNWYMSLVEKNYRDVIPHVRNYSSATEQSRNLDFNS